MSHPGSQSGRQRTGIGMLNYITDLHRNIKAGFRRHERRKERLANDLDHNSERLRSRMWQMKQDRLNSKNLRGAGDLQSYLSQMGIINHKGRPTVYGKKKNTYYEDLEDVKTGESILGGPVSEVDVLVAKHQKGRSLNGRLLQGNSHAQRASIDVATSHNTWFLSDTPSGPEMPSTLDERDRLAALREQVEADMEAAEQAKLGKRISRVDHTPKHSIAKMKRNRGSVFQFNPAKARKSTRKQQGNFMSPKRGSVLSPSGHHKRGSFNVGAGKLTGIQEVESMQVPVAPPMTPVSRTFVPSRSGSLYRAASETKRAKAYSINLGNGNTETKAKRGKAAFIHGMDQNALLALLASNQQLKENIDELAAAELETWPEEEDENQSGNSTDRFNLSSSRTKESARGPISPTVGMYEKTAVVVTSPRMPDVVVINSSAEMGYIPATPEAVRHNYKSFSSPVYDGKHFTKKVYKDRAWRRHDSPKRRGRKQSKKPLTSRQLSIARKVHALEPIVTPKELAGMFKLHENEHLHKLMKRFDR